MTQKDKELLLKDLYARLPYGVIGQCEIDASYDTSFDTIFQTHKFNAVVYGLKADLLFVTPLIEDKDEKEFANEEVADGVDILDFKPYLFPLSSMTEEQKEEYYSLADDVTIKPIPGRLGMRIHCIKLGISDNPHEEVWDYVDLDAIDWLNKNHFDYRGLIKKGLAIDATGLNIY